MTRLIQASLDVYSNSEAYWYVRLLLVLSAGAVRATFHLTISMRGQRETGITGIAGHL